MPNAPLVFSVPKGYTRRVLLGLPLVLLAAQARAEAGIVVIASFSILADLVRAVGGSYVSVTALVGPDQDTHAYQPRPSDARALNNARMWATNGLGLEGWAARLAQSAGFKGVAVITTNGMTPLRSGAGRGAVDPHAWQDVANVKRYIANIAAGLTAADPSHTVAYQAAAAGYGTQLDALDGEIRAAWADIPRANRKIITSHDAFAYYAAAYGVDFRAPQSALADGDPTPRHLAGLIRQIRAEKARALFLENISAGQVLNQVARETGVRIGGRVYSDALSGPTGPAGTYLDMMRHNTRLFTQAVR